MTSAYDSSSDHGLSSNPHDGALFSDHPTSVGAERRADVKSTMKRSTGSGADYVSSDDYLSSASIPNMDKICASPGEKFYKVTIMDSDSDRFKLSDTELTNNNLSSTPLKPINGCATSPRTRLDILLTELEHVERSSDQFPKHGSRLSYLRTEDHDLRSVFDWTDGAGSLEQPSIKHLISEAENLVDTKWTKIKSRRKRLDTDSSVMSDDSCDASSEYTESEVEVDYSSALSDAGAPPGETLFSSPNLDSSVVTVISNEPIAAPTAVLRPRADSNRRKRERPKSMQDVPDVEEVDVKPYSISESAIADLRAMKAHGTPPLKGRRYHSLRTRSRASKIKRSRSESEKLSGKVDFTALSNNSSSDRTVNAVSGADSQHLSTSTEGILDGVDRSPCHVIGEYNIQCH